jgi:hypothetical protein
VNCFKPGASRSSLDAGLGPLRADLERFWGQALDNYKRLVERRVEEEA